MRVLRALVKCIKQGKEVPTMNLTFALTQLDPSADEFSLTLQPFAGVDEAWTLTYRDTTTGRTVTGSGASPEAAIDNARRNR